MAGEPTTETLKTSDVGERLDELIDRVAGRRGRRIVIQRDGVPVAAVVSIADLEWFDHLVAQREERFKVLDEIGRAFADVSDEEVEREALKAVAEVRAEMKAERRQAATVHE
jgi:prevent-host-death family protein